MGRILQFFELPCNSLWSLFCRFYQRELVKHMDAAREITDSHFCLFEQAMETISVRYIDENLVTALQYLSGHPDFQMIRNENRNAGFQLKHICQYFMKLSNAPDNVVAWNCLFMMLKYARLEGNMLVNNALLQSTLLAAQKLYRTGATSNSYECQYICCCKIIMVILLVAKPKRNKLYILEEVKDGPVEQWIQGVWNMDLTLNGVYLLVAFRSYYQQETVSPLHSTLYFPSHPTQSGNYIDTESTL